MKYLIYFFISISLFLFVSCVTNKKNIFEKQNLKNGIYFGQNSSFFPQPMFFAFVKNDTVKVYSYYPLKGKYFFLHKDTLLFDNNKYIGKVYEIYSKNHHSYIKYIHKSNDYWSKTNTKLDFSPDRLEYFEKIKSISTNYYK